VGGGFGGRDMSELLEVLIDDIQVLGTRIFYVGKQDLTRDIRLALREMIIRAEKTEKVENRWWLKTCSEGVLLYNSSQLQIGAATDWNHDVSKGFFSPVAKDIIAQVLIMKNALRSVQMILKEANEKEEPEPVTAPSLEDKRAAAAARKRKQLKVEADNHEKESFVKRLADRNQKKREARKRRESKKTGEQENMLGKRIPPSSDAGLD
jgi:hypothetical protein